MPNGYFWFRRRTKIHVSLTMFTSAPHDYYSDHYKRLIITTLVFLFSYHSCLTQYFPMGFQIFVFFEDLPHFCGDCCIQFNKYLWVIVGRIILEIIQYFEVSGPVNAVPNQHHTFLLIHLGFYHIC